MTRAESLGGLRQVRAVVPVSVHDQELEATSLGTPDRAALRRPARSVSRARWSGCTRSPTRSRRTRRPAARSRPTGSPGIAGFAPSTFHAIGSRVAAEQLRRGFQLVGHQRARAAVAAVRRRARVMEQTYPVPPLLPGHALAIGVTSYDGQVFYGVTADRDLVPDADTVRVCLSEALDELLDTAGDGAAARCRAAAAPSRAGRGDGR